MHDFVDGVMMLLNVTSFVAGVVVALVACVIVRKIKSKKSGGV